MVAPFGFDASMAIESPQRAHSPPCSFQSRARTRRRRLDPIGVSLPPFCFRSDMSDGGPDGLGDLDDKSKLGAGDILGGRMGGAGGSGLGVAMAVALDVEAYAIGLG